jgi:hypothetical protein
MTNTLDADARWAAAASLADGVADSGVQKRRRVTFLWLGALIVVSLALGFALALWLLPDGGGTSSSESSDEARLIVSIVVGGIGAVLGVGGFIWARRTGRYITRWSAVISPLNMQEKKSVRKQLAGKESVDEMHLSTILAIARQNQRVTQGLVPLYGAIVLLDLATAFSTPYPLLQYLNVAVALMFIAVGAFLAVIYRRTDAFIDQHSTRKPL